MQAASSEHLLPEEDGLEKRSSREHELFRNLKVWRVSKAWLNDH